MEETELTERPQLTFFERLRKKIFLATLKADKYQGQPQFIKDDEEVIDKLLAREGKNILLLSKKQRDKRLNENPKYIRFFNYDEQEKILDEYPQYISSVDKDFAKSQVCGYYSVKKLECIRYLPIEEQVKMLTEDFNYISPKTHQEERNYSRGYAKGLKYFSPEVIEQVFKMDFEKEKEFKEKNPWREYHSMFGEFSLQELNTETQLKLALMDYRLISRMPKETINVHVNGNPEIIKGLPPKEQLKIANENSKFVKVMDFTTQIDYLKQNLGPATNTREDVIFNYMQWYSPSDIKFDTVRQIKKVIVHQSNPNFKDDLSMITDVTRNPEWLIELGKFAPDALMTNFWRGNDRISPLLKVQHLIEMYTNYLGIDAKNAPIISEISRFKQRINGTGNDGREQIIEEFNQLPKLLLNDKIMANIDKEEIAEYIRKPQRAKLIKIVEDAYGEKASQIIKDRKDITIEEIPNFYIFDEKILNEFGIGTVHNCLSYITKGACVLSDLDRNPEEFKKFKQFSEITGEYFNGTALDMEKKLTTFYRLSDFLGKVNISSLTDIQKNNFLLAINDKCRASKTGDIIELNGINDLDTYTEKRDLIFNEAMEKTNDANGAKELICRKYFGIDYANDTVFTNDKVDVERMVNYYNIENFVNNPITLKSGNFSEEDLDSLELLSVISKIKDVDTLKEIYSELKGKENVLNPLDFKELKEKVPMQYSKELIDSLLTVEEAVKRAENGEKGISLREEEGVRIIRLEGIRDFRILMHSMGLNNSGIDTKGYAREELWKNLENGISTISGCVVEPDMLHSCAGDRRLNLGFTKINSNQILGMGHTDVHVSHAGKLLNPEFTTNDASHVQYNYPDELVRRTAAQISGIESKDITHQYNEVAMLRREQNNSAIEEDTFGGRIFPDYTVVMGKANTYDIDSAKKLIKGDKPTIVEIVLSAYNDMTYMRANKKSEEITPRQETNFMKSIKNKARGGGYDR